MQSTDQEEHNREHYHEAYRDIAENVEHVVRRRIIA